MGLSESGGVPNLKRASATVDERTVMPLFLFTRNKNTRHRNYPSFTMFQHLTDRFFAFYGLNVSGVVVENQYFFARWYETEKNYQRKRRNTHRGYDCTWYAKVVSRTPYREHQRKKDSEN